MGILITAKDASLEYPTKLVLDGVTLGVNEGDRIGIVGRNGDGKSTLIDVLAGIEPLDSGKVICRGGTTIGMLEQTDGFTDDMVVGTIINGGNPEYVWASDRRAREIVDELLGDVALDARIGTLSGGQRRRVDLSRLLIGNWDVLMLDEPTNHLDMEAITWLAEHLKTRWQKNAGALLVVTHDRWFLDEACTRMWEVHDGKVDPFEGGYSAYILQRVERDRQANLAEQKRQNMARKELAWLSRGARARATKPKFHMETAKALIADVPPLRNKLELKQMATARLGKTVVDLNDVCLTRGTKQVLRDCTWMIGPGDRIGILGANGAGKTSILKLISGKLKPTLGHVKIGKTVKFAVLSQQLEELAPFEDDMVRVVLSRYKTTYEVDGRSMSPGQLLERLGFDHTHLKSRIKDLSGGQRRRLQLLLILLDEPNVLLLDEPGNDLDTDMMAVTEELLDSWPGTLIVVSHDRYFTERVTDDQYALIDGHLRHVPGGVDEYLQLAMAAQAHAKGSKQAAPQTPAVAAPLDGNGSSLPAALAHKLRKEAASLERKMATQAKRVEEAQAAMAAADPTDFEELGRLQKKVEEAGQAQDLLETEWLEISERLEA